MTARRDLLIGGAVAGVALAAGAGWAWRRRSAAEAVDVPAEVWTQSFPMPGGGQLAMASLRGRPLVVNFWATWCAPCIKELPLFDRFHREHKGLGWQVVGIAIDRAEAVKSFLAKHPVGFPMGVAGMEGAELMILLGNGAGALPFTVVFDRDGRMRHRRLGETHYDDLLGWARTD